MPICTRAQDTAHLLVWAKSGRKHAKQMNESATCRTTEWTRPFVISDPDASHWGVTDKGWRPVVSHLRGSTAIVPHGDPSCLCVPAATCHRTSEPHAFRSAPIWGAPAPWVAAVLGPAVLRAASG